MKLIPQDKLNKSLDKPLLKYRPLRSEIDLFKAELITVLDHIDNTESEEFHKNLVSNFLTKAFYADTHFINTKGRQDLVIHTGKDNKHSVGVIIEAKRPINKAEWFTPDKPNSKALQELVLYYLQERIEAKNIDIKYLIATNINEWYIIESSYFKKLFYDNKKLVKDYEDWRDGKKDGKDTGVFYNDIAKPFIDSLPDEIPCIYFNIREHEKALRNKEDYSSKELNALFKILSPYHLLKVPFANDSNELDEKFYKELLHIIGLEEAKEGGKNIIRRKKENKNLASLLEKAIDELKTEGLHKVPDLKSFGDTSEEQYFNIALELCITWVNRVLFLKLLEGQLINYHKGDQQYRFLNSTTINDFDELFKLFHKVLAVDIPHRNPSIQQKYSRIPYLNSSLFEISELEDVTIKINAIDSNDTLEYISSTILKEDKKKNTKLLTIEYLFQFLDAYDFASEGTGDTQEDNKTLINASVLGKVFEKINGYKDGSIYTPGFITMYMSRQSIRLAVVQKFNDENGWACKDFADLDNYIEYQKPEARNKANALINDLKLCDPAVGSGHFLVSALNEIIAIKSELKILQDINGKRLKEYIIDVINDELIITDEDNDLFIYNPQSPQSQLIQQTLFNEKQTIIENCLFGVDINPNSVKICMLRLWIELLKNSYYKEGGELETLPNIDINIKCGNSLLSRLSLDSDLSTVFTQKKYNYKLYRQNVENYKNTSSKADKDEYKKFITEIKEKFKEAFSINDKLVRELSNTRGQLYLLDNLDLFGNAKKTPEAVKLEKAKLVTSIEDIEKQIQEKKDNVLFKNAFEWRFEFPEVLNNNGDFVGFDIIIGNPPYGVSIKGQLRDAIVNALNKVPDFEIYYFFINLAKQILKPQGIKSYIIPNTMLFNVFAKNYRENLFNMWDLNEILDCTDFNIFEGSATVRCIITLFTNKPSSDLVSYRPTEKATSFIELTNRKLSVTTKDTLIANNQNWALVFKLSSSVLSLILRIKTYPQLSKDFDVSQGYIPYRKSDLIKIYGMVKAKEIVEKREWHSNIKIDSDYKQEIWGANLTKYSYSTSGSYIRYGKHLAGFVDLKYFNQTRLLIREITSPKIIGCIVTEELVNDPQIISVIPKTNTLDLKFLWAIFNSSFATFFHFNSSPKATKGAFPKILVEDIKNFPIPIISLENQRRILNIVDQILLLKKANPDASTVFLEQQVDNLIYKLYELTPDEIAIVENSGNSKNNEPENQLQQVDDE